MSQYYQGDVGLINTIGTKTTHLPKNAIKQQIKGPLILEYGEQTGHKHQLATPEGKVNLYLEGTKRFLEVCYALPLTHEEHDAITLEPGIYEIKRQRQWSVLKQMSQKVKD
jgi:hypothetical protein